MSDKTQLVNIQKYLCDQPIDIINYDDGEYYLSTESALELAQQILDICQPQWNIGVNYPIKDGDVIVKKNGRIFLSNISGGKFNCGDQGQIECYQYYNYPRTPHE